VLGGIYEQNYHISMKKIIYKKIASDCIKFFLLTIFTISTIIWVLQAVNYLDFVIEDGHGFFVYFNYTLLSFPKIFSKIFPFAIFLTFSYILLKYENKNELVIFWNFGIKKINFINFFIKFSFIFVLLSLLLNAVITPLTQDKARSFIRSSDLGFFASILKPKKFIDVIVGITVYFDEKTAEGKLKNIFLNDGEGQTTFAKSGELDLRNGRRILVLYDGKTVNNKKGIFSQFEFTKSDFNLTKFTSKTITQRKTQENSTSGLYECLLILKKSKEKIKHINAKIGENCKLQNLENIYEELYTRLIKPFYITFLISISLLLVLKSKQDHKFKLYKITVFLFGFLFIIFLESSSKFISINIFQNLIISFLPIIFMSLIYFYFLIQLKINKS
jgi:lipopolysaccharide export system permease protein|tara:strand:+ start:221 stop:1384 length:1164 start_codon:yes stop_codon:yes gene_type:complete